MRNKLRTKKELRIRRHKRVRAKIDGTKQRPRFCVYRSNKTTYAQIVDDEKGITLFSASDFDLTESARKQKKLARAADVGEYIAKKAKEAGIEEVRFDRGGYRYHGRVKALADGARKGKLKF